MSRLYKHQERFNFIKGVPFCQFAHIATYHISCLCLYKMTELQLKSQEEVAGIPGKNTIVSCGSRCFISVLCNAEIYDEHFCLF